MPHKLLFLSIIVGIVIGVGTVGATRAYFTASATSAVNTFTTAAVFPTGDSGPTINPGDVVINEINWGGSNAPGGGSDEWVELKNMTAHQIDMSGWVVVNLTEGNNGTLTLPSGSIIPANGFFLISNKDKEHSAINVDPDWVTTAVSLENGGEQLTLKTSDTGTVIDTANGTGKWLAGSNSTPNKSMERKTPPGDGTQAANWQDSSSHTNMDGNGTNDEFGTPKAENSL